MEINGIVYGHSFDNLEKAIHRSSAEQQRLASNIANIESENYQKVRFQSELEKAQSRRQSKEALLDQEITKLADQNLKMTSYVQMMSNKLKLLKKVVTLGKS